MKAKFRKLFCTTLFLALTTFLISQTASAVTINVPSQYATIQAAIDASSSGDVVLVSPGTYVENIDFKGKNITVGSLFLTTGISSYIDSTIIDGNANSNPVVQFHSGETRDAILTGFTIQNGYTTNNEWGAGIDIRLSSTQPTLKNLVIKNNNAQSGRGGGIALYYAGTPLVEKVKILNNICSDAGGGIYAFQSNLDLNEVVITGNSANAGSAIHWNSALTITIKNSLIYNNPSQIYGAVILQGNAHNVYNTTIANNDAGPCKIGIFAGAGNTYLNNTIVSGHNGYNIDITSGMVFVNYSLIEGGSASIKTVYAESLKWNTGNLAAGPLFVDPANGNYHLQVGSPCIDTGDNSAPGIPTTDIEGDTRTLDGDKDGTATVDMGADEYIPPVVMRDNNNDGTDDIILRNGSTGQHTLWCMNTDGSHSSKVLLTNNQNFIVVGIGDINADGISDILWTNSSSGQHTLWFMNADGSHASKTLLKNADWTIAGTGDINGDGVSDIIWSNTTTGQHTVWFMNADGTRTSKTLLTNLAWAITGTGDINADGRDDIIWSNSSTGQHALWFMKTDGSHSSKTLLTNLAWAVAGTGDYNADGITDILWRRASTGYAIIWFMNADGTRASFKDLLTDPNMMIGGTGDYNTDGISDILWSNISTGQHTIWYMNTDGTAASTKVILTNTAWTIEP